MSGIVPTTQRITRPEATVGPAVYAPAGLESDTLSQKLHGTELGHMRLPWESVIVEAGAGAAGGWVLIEDVAADWFACPFSDQGPLRIWPGRERPTADFTGLLQSRQRPLELREGGCVRLAEPTRIWWVWSPARFSDTALNTDRALVIAGVAGSACVQPQLDWDHGRVVRTNRRVAALSDTELPIRLADARSRELWLQNPPKATTNVAYGETGSVDANGSSENGFQLTPGEAAVIGPRLGAKNEWYAIRETAAAAYPLNVFDFRRVAPWEIDPTE